MGESFQGSKVLVVGLGKSGAATARYLAGAGAALVLTDSREAPGGIEQVRAAVPQGEFHLGEAARRRKARRAGPNDPDGANDRSLEEKNGGEPLRLVVVGGRAFFHPVLEVLDRAADDAVAPFAQVEFRGNLLVQ